MGADLGLRLMSLERVVWRRLCSAFLRWGAEARRISGQRTSAHDLITLYRKISRRQALLLWKAPPNSSSTKIEVAPRSTKIGTFSYFHRWL